MGSRNPSFGEGGKKKVGRKVCDFHAKLGQHDLCLYGPGGKKKMGRPKTDGRSAPRTRKKPFRLEVGRAYRTRCGQGVVRIVSDALPGSYSMHGCWEVRPPDYSHLRDSTFTPAGGYWNSGREDEWDLIREVPSAKRPGARRAKGSKK